MSSAAAMAQPEKCFSAAEVSRHNREDDLWLIKDGKVYDMTPYYKHHPGSTFAHYNFLLFQVPTSHFCVGGNAMLKHGGKDVTFVLPQVMAHGFSQDFIKSKLEELCIGWLES